jgi:molecular chaperone GrpE (heat shock protein)
MDKRFTQRDGYGNADIINLSPEKLYSELNFEETNLLTDALNRFAELEDKAEEWAEERENMQAEIIGLENKVDRERNWGKIHTKQAIKDTAKEIIAFLMQFEGYANYAGEDLAERYGVEVE